MNKFMRQYKLEITTETGEVVTITNPLTVDFNITVKNFATSAQADFKVYNLSQSSRDIIFRDWSQTYLPNPVIMPIKFYSGYVDSAPLVFTGEVKVAKSYRQSGQTNFITGITAFEYGDAEVNGHSSFTMPAGTTKRNAILRLINDLQGVSLGFVSDFPETYQRAVTFMGNTADKLRELTGGLFFVHHGKAFVIKQGDFIAGDLVTLDSFTGLLGVPELDRDVVTAEVLFEPRLICGQKIALKTEDYQRLNDDYIVVGFNHSGTISDAVSGKIKTTVRMKKLKSVVAV